VQKTRESLFQQVVKETCRDGKISPEEFAILKRLAALLGIETSTGNRLAAEIIDKYKAGELKFSPVDKPEALYRDVLLAFNDDNVIDGNEDALLETIRNWLDLPAQEASTDGGSDSKATRESILEVNGDIKPLRCDACNGQIPLLRRPEVKCPYCNASKAIPNIYLEALASRTSFETRRKQALQLFDKLGSKPSNFEETLAELDQQMLLVSFVLSLGFIIATVQFIVFYPLDWYYARFLQLNMTDVIPHWLPAMLATLVTFFLSVVPFGLLYIVRRKVLSLKHVQVALSANPPQKPGGPATCRSCGSPFEVPPDAAGVTCPYCQTDNLLQVPGAWLQETRDLSIQVGKSATTAENVFKKETRLGWESVLSVFLLFVFLGAINWLWLAEIKPPEHLRQEMIWLENYYDEISDKRLVRQVKSIGKDFPVGEWIEDAYEIEEFYIALAPGEKLQLTWDIASTTIKLQNYSELEATMYLVRGYSEGFSHLLESKRFTRLQPDAFSPGFGGWYRVKLMHESMINFKLKAELITPETPAPAQ
jgi:DNA-directed RNA polymerase subunit RPC12/RpoP